MAVAASSSNTAKDPEQSLPPLPKLSPPAPRRLARVTTEPSGCTRARTRLPSNVWLRRTRTLTSLSASAPASGTTIGTSSVLRSGRGVLRSEEHTSELQSRRDLVCRLLLEKKKKNTLTRTVKNKKPKIEKTQR